MRREIIIALVLLAGTVALYASLSLMEDPAAATFPRVVILIMGVLSVALLLQGLLTRQQINKAALQGDRVEEGDQPAAAPRYPIGTVLACFGLIVVYFWVMERIGFYASAFLFFVTVTFLLGRRDLTPKKGGMRVGFALAFTAVLYVLFNRLLVVQTPKGILF